MKHLVRLGAVALLTGACALVSASSTWAQDSTFWSPAGSASGGRSTAEGAPGSIGGSGPGGGAGTQSFPSAVLAAATGQQSMSSQQLGDIMRSAQPALRKPGSLPTGIDTQKVTLSTAGASGPAEMTAGAGPSIGGSAGNAEAVQALAAAVSGQKNLQAGGGAITPNNYGTVGVNSVYHYSDRLVNGNGYFDYPQSTVGYFLFTFNGSNYFYCSATMISRSLITAAGHCVHKGGTGLQSDFITAGYFIPACLNCNTGSPYRAYGFAGAGVVVTSGGWYSGGLLDQGYDVSVITLGKRDGTSNEMGVYTGWLGFCFLNCLQPAFGLTQYGFPGNYYGGNWMFEGQHLEVSDGRDFIYGSGAQGGSSGGPHIANVGSISDSSSNAGQFSLRNIVFAVTSWGYVDQSIKIQGASSLSGPGNGNNYVGMYNLACIYARAYHGTGSCGFL